MLEFRSLFSRTFVESSTEISRHLERYFAETKGDIRRIFGTATKFRAKQRNVASR